MYSRGLDSLAKQQMSSRITENRNLYIFGNSIMNVNFMLVKKSIKKNDCVPSGHYSPLYSVEQKLTHKQKMLIFWTQKLVVSTQTKKYIYTYIKAIGDANRYYTPHHTLTTQ